MRPDQRLNTTYPGALPIHAWLDNYLRRVVPRTPGGPNLARNNRALPLHDHGKPEQVEAQNDVTM